MGPLQREQVDRFVQDLKSLRLAAGSPTLNLLVELSRGTDAPLARSTVSDKLNAKSPPDWDFVAAFVQACGAASVSSGRALPPEMTDLVGWRARHLNFVRLLAAVGSDDRTAAFANSEISKHPQGNSSLAPQVGVARPTPKQLPAANPYFTGRDEELSLLDELAELVSSEGGMVVISAIEGTAGIGKTGLAVQWAHRVADRFPGGQLYIDLRGFDPSGHPPVTAGEAVRAFLDAFEIDRKSIPDGYDAQVALYRSLVAPRSMLIVLDNAKNASHVEPLLPGSAGCFVICTSRNHLTRLIARDGARPLTLDVLKPGEARQLLEARIGASRVAASRDAANEIVNLCARLPLALAVVTARAAAHPHFGLDAIAAELRATQGSLDGFESDDSATDVRVALSWSYDGLSVDAARLFRMAGLQPGPDIGINALASLVGTSGIYARRWSRAVSNAHLFEEPAPLRYSFHDLLRTYALELGQQLDSDDERRAAAVRLLDYYLHSAHDGSAQLFPLVGAIVLETAAPQVRPEKFTSYESAWSWFEAENRTLRDAVSFAIEFGSHRHAWQIAWALQDYYRRSGHWHDWLATQTAALAASRAARDRYGQAHSHHGLGRANTWLRRFRDAESHLRSAIRLFKRLGDVAAEAHAELDLGQTFSLSDRAAEALPHAERGLELALLVGDRRIQAKAMNNRGWYHGQLGDGENAKQSCLDGLAIFEELGDLRGQSNTLDSVGYAYHLLGDHANANEYYMRCLPLRRELGDSHGEAATHEHIGDALFALGRPTEALDSWASALEIFNRLEHPDSKHVAVKIAAAANGGV
jgi:tetratricopeptide (TPR) repeat protein